MKIKKFNMTLRLFANAVVLTLRTETHSSTLCHVFSKIYTGAFSPSPAQ